MNRNITLQFLWLVCQLDSSFAEYFIQPPLLSAGHSVTKGDTGRTGLHARSHDVPPKNFLSFHPLLPGPP